MTVRVEPKVLAALDVIAAKRRAATGKSVSMNEVIWFLVEAADKDVADMISRIPEEENKPVLGIERK